MKLVLRRMKRYLVSILVSLFGMGSLFAADILLATHASNEALATWATLKSSLMIGAVVVLLGTEQLIVRNPESLAIVAKVVIPQSILAGIVVALLVFHLGYFSSIPTAFLCVFGIAWVNLAFQWLRSNLCIVRAYITLGAWRLIFISVCIASILFSSSSLDNLEGLVVISLYLGWCIIVPVVVSAKRISDVVSHHTAFKSRVDVYRSSLLFFLASLSLSITSYGEHLLVFGLGETEDVALYFKAVTFFLMPGVFLNQYLSTVVGPWLRQNEKKGSQSLLTYKFLLLLMLFCSAPVLLIFGVIAQKLLLGEMVTPLVLAVIFTITAIVRFLYIVPSTYVGMIADRKELKRVTLYYILFAIGFLFLSELLVSIGMTVIYAVALANLINWCCRSLVGFGFVRYRMNLNRSSKVN